MKKLYFLLIALLLSLNLDQLANAQSFDPRGAGGLTAGAAIPIGNATAAAPTFVEGTPVSASFDLVGNMRMTLGTLLACEDIPNNLCTVSGGAVRGTVGNVVNGAVGDSTGTASAMYTGVNRIRAVITGAGAVVQTIKIYGGNTSGMAAATSDLLCTINLSGTSGAAGTADGCPPFDGPYLFLLPVMSASSGAPTTVVTNTY